MKPSQPKRILIALVIGFALSFFSLLYKREMETTVYNTCERSGTASVCAYWNSTQETLHIRGFPFSAVVLEQDGSIKYVTLSLFAGNWLVYSVLAFIGLQFWRPKPKAA